MDKDQISERLNANNEIAVYNMQEAPEYMNKVKN